MGRRVGKQIDDAVRQTGMKMHACFLRRHILALLTDRLLVGDAPFVVCSLILLRSHSVFDEHCTVFSLRLLLGAWGSKAFSP